MASTTRTVPTLQSLALNAVADAINHYEPECLLSLPLGGAKEIVTQLAKSGRLRPETLRPLLLSDWSSAEELATKLGGALVSAAPVCRGLGALAAQRLRFEERQRAAAAAREKAATVQDDDDDDDDDDDPLLYGLRSSGGDAGQRLPAGTRRSDSAALAALPDDLRCEAVR